MKKSRKRKISRKSHINFNEQYVNDLENLICFYDAARLGLEATKDSAHALELLEKFKMGSNEPKKRSERLSEFSTTESKHGHPTLHALLTIRLWSILEAFVYDFIIVILTRHSELMESNDIKSLQGSLIEFSLLSIDKQAEFIINLLNDKTSPEYKHGISRFERILKSIGLGAPIPNVVKDTVLELQQVRHALVHCNGHADEQLVQYCPWLDAENGHELHLCIDDFIEYHYVINWYILELSRRWLQKFPEDEKDDSTTIESLNESLANYINNLKELRKRKKVYD